MSTPQIPHHEVSRRGVIRTAAWSVPAVTIATAAPAFAASGDQLRLNYVSSSWGGTLDYYLYVELQAENLSVSNAAGPFDVNLTFQDEWTSGATSTIISRAIDVDPGDGGLFADWGNGWDSPGSTTQAATSGAVASRAVSHAGLPAGGASTLRFRVRKQNSTRPLGALVGASIAAAPSGFSIASDSITGFQSPA